MTFNDLKTGLRKYNYVPTVDDYSKVAVQKGDSESYEVHIFRCNHDGKIFDKPVAEIRGDIMDGFDVYGSLSDDALLLMAHFATTPFSQRF